MSSRQYRDNREEPQKEIAKKNRKKRKIIKKKKRFVTPEKKLKILLKMQSYAPAIWQEKGRV